MPFPNPNTATVQALTCASDQLTTDRRFEGPLSNPKCQLQVTFKSSETITLFFLCLLFFKLRTPIFMFLIDEVWWSMPLCYISAASICSLFSRILISNWNFIWFWRSCLHPCSYGEVHSILLAIAMASGEGTWCKAHPIRVNFRSSALWI